MEYTIKNIKDLCEVVTLDNYERLSEDINIFLQTIAKLKQESTFIIPEELMWIDDGKHDLTLKFENGDYIEFHYENSA